MYDYLIGIILTAIFVGFILVFYPTSLGKESMTETQPIEFTPVWPHGEIQEIFPNIFFVTGTNKIHHDGKDIQTSRNMTIVRNGKELTLVNSVRLDDAGLKKLDKLGQVTHIVRIGAFHGRDDAFYRDRYPKAQLWVVKGMIYENGLELDRELEPKGDMPFPGCSLFVFETSNQPEGILHLNREGGILITCDSIQNITATDKFYSEATAKFTQDHGLVKPANISFIWLGATHTKATDFERLLRTTPFRHLITAHGEPLMNKAYEQVSATVKRVFPSEKK